MPTPRSIFRCDHCKIFCNKALASGKLKEVSKWITIEWFAFRKIFLLMFVSNLKKWCSTVFKWTFFSGKRAKSASASLLSQVNFASKGLSSFFFAFFPIFSRHRSNFKLNVGVRLTGRTIRFLLDSNPWCWCFQEKKQNKIFEKTIFAGF